MATLVTRFSETRIQQLSLALLLTDGATGSDELLGTVTVDAGTGEAPFQKHPAGTFLFFRLAAGAHTVKVRSVEGIYVPVDITVNIPMPTPLWPAFPDRSLADVTKPLDDPAQPAAYRAQRAAAALMPSTLYPFAPGATLLRGVVSLAGAPLAGATVRKVGDAAAYVTGTDGSYVLPFANIAGMSETVTVRASYSSQPDKDESVTLSRGMTASKNIAM